MTDIFLSPGTAEPFTVGGWFADPASNTLTRDVDTTTLEPKVMDLLVLLASRPEQVLSREVLSNALWPDVIVGEDSLARLVSKLRRALGDQRDAPQFIETIPKRGYRLIAAVEAQANSGGTRLTQPRQSRAWLLWVAGIVLTVAAGLMVIHPYPEPVPESVRANTPVAEMTDRANDLYMQFKRADNEAAIALYERAISVQPDYAPAQAGLANALVQRVVRWQGAPGEPAYAASVGQALSLGLTVDAGQGLVLERAAELARRAIRLSPRNADAYKALGLVLSAQGRVEQAQHQYERAIELDPNNWEAMANLAELTQLAGNEKKSLELLERTYRTMQTMYAEEPQRIGPWLAPLGVMIGDAYQRQGDGAAAEAWYRRVLNELPYEPIATTRLARILRERGDTRAALQLCEELASRVGEFEGCYSSVD